MSPLSPSVTSPIDILRAARELISTPEKWIQGSLASNGTGKSIQVRSPTATCFCMSGAVLHICDGHINWRALDLLGDVIPTNIPEWNDDPVRTHAEVLDAFDRAIALADQAVQS